MKERPILFSAPMVRSILEDLKTNTRRVINPQPTLDCTLTKGILPPTPPSAAKAEFDASRNVWLFSWPDVPRNVLVKRCPYGVPGDRLWVRETFMRADGADCRENFIGTDMEVVLSEPSKRWWYRATDEAKGEGFKWRPSIFMPRNASRITLEITDVRVQRLQEISEEDAIAEGIEKRGEFPNITPWTNYLAPKGCPGAMHFSTPRRSFQSLWDSINAKRGFGWDSNPWVWAIKFRRIA